MKPRVKPTGHRCFTKYQEPFLFLIFSRDKLGEFKEKLTTTIFSLKNTINVAEIAELPLKQKIKCRKIEKE
jgi:hypothetical protein